MLDEVADRTLRVEVWTRERSPPPGNGRRETVATLRELEATGVLADVSIHTWGRSVPASPPEDGESLVHDRIEAFESWAACNGHSLEPAFRYRERTTLVSEHAEEVVHLPLQCLAVYDRDDLVAVFPCTNEDGTNTAAECVARLDPAIEDD
ncbi:HTH domain-containing protein [Halorubellus litoreus]|uniref:HTH domain-containing protein n=1 Tax=Halorubellus litoreus TaxID=755308 RepID=A0ABD5VDK9_9EURY